MDTKETQAKIRSVAETLKALSLSGYRTTIANRPRADVPLGEGLSDAAADLFDRVIGNSYIVAEPSGPGGFELFEAGLFEMTFASGEVHYAPTEAAYALLRIDDVLKAERERAGS